MSDEDDDDFGHIRWWDDYEITGKTEASRERQSQIYFDRLNKLYEYCKTDVEAERLAEKKLYPLIPSEREVYLLDQRINDRGIGVDLETARLALGLVEQGASRLNARLVQITDSLVTSLNQRDKLVRWFASKGSHFPSLDKQGITNALKDKTLPAEVREVLYLRQIGAKSSTKKLQAILNMADAEGRIHGNLLYHGASTGRFAGKGVQLQNLPRPELLKEPEDAIPYIHRGNIDEIELCYGPVQTVVADVIRSLIQAGPGKVLYAADFAAIEARVLAWIAGQDSLVKQFANGDDIYCNFASLVYKKPLNKKEHPKERQLGKACIAEGTLVYTDHGLVPIEQVTFDMKVWDGGEWVEHLGVLSNYTQSVLPLCGIWLTPDHRVLCGTNWLDAKCLAQDGGSLSLALATAAENSPSQDTSRVLGAELRASLFGAIAAPENTRCLTTHIEISPAHDAPYARTLKAELHEKIFGGMRRFAPTTTTGRACLTASQRFLRGVGTQMTPDSTTTAEGGLTYTSLGSKIEGNFSSIYSPSKIGMFLNSKLIGLIMTPDICPEICGFHLDKKISQTGGLLLKCNSESKTLKPVYDLVNAGPRNRFTIHTDHGPLIVHNCILGLGYAMGAPKFALTCAKDQIFLEEEEYKRVVTLYRKTYRHIPKLWYALERAAIKAINNPSRVVTLRNMKFRMRDDNLRLLLPSGRALNYPKAKVDAVKTPWGETKQGVVISAVNALTRKWERTVVSPGTFTENVVQAVSRDLMVESMFRLERHNYPVVLTVHDEVVSEVDEGYGDVAEYEALVAATPEWAAGLPVKAEGWSGKRYRK